MMTHLHSSPLHRRRGEEMWINLQIYIFVVVVGHRRPYKSHKVSQDKQQHSFEDLTTQIY